MEEQVYNVVNISKSIDDHKSQNLNIDLRDKKI